MVPLLFILGYYWPPTVTSLCKEKGLVWLMSSGRKEKVVQKRSLIVRQNDRRFELSCSLTKCVTLALSLWICLVSAFRDSNLVDSASSIRLSQRLSHACLSINKSILWNCEWLIISVIVYLMVLTTWITVVILELIHASNPDLRRGVFIRLKPMRGNPVFGDS